MGNKVVPDMPQKLSKEELDQRQYNRQMQELRIARTRAKVITAQIVQAYTILESLRFDYLSDTMFRGYITKAKEQLEGALSDFLLFDPYWDNRIKEMRKMTPAEFDEYFHQTTSPKQGKIK